MLDIGRLLTHGSHKISRRAMLQAGSLGAVGWSLADLLRCEAKEPARGPARSVILLWLWGGPSHLDTFDLKPKAPLEYRGPYRPIATSAPGVEICELLPQLARHADKYAILRSLYTGSNDHGIAGTIGLTGSIAGAQSLGGQTLPGQVKPAHGSVAAKVLGFSANMPTFVSLGGHLHQGHRRITGEGGGSLGGLYDPFRLEYDPEVGVKAPQLELI
jgi:hypothetical protein